MGPAFPCHIAFIGHYQSDDKCFIDSHSGLIHEKFTQDYILSKQLLHGNSFSLFYIQETHPLTFSDFDLELHKIIDNKKNTCPQHHVSLTNVQFSMKTPTLQLCPPRFVHLTCNKTQLQYHVMIKCPSK